LHPYSRGTIAIKSTNPFVEPAIDPRYGSNPIDLQIIVEGIKFQRRLLSTAPMLELLPVELLPPQWADDAALELFAKVGLETEYHPSGTTSMLPKELGGVVDAKLLVYNTANLRVVDAGIFPLLPGSHIQAAVYAVAEKVGTLIYFRLKCFLTYQHRLLILLKLIKFLK
jgi:choline dehydrogenase